MHAKGQISLAAAVVAPGLIVTATPGLGLLIVTLIAKMPTFAVSQESGLQAGRSSRRCPSAERPGSSSTA